MSKARFTNISTMTSLVLLGMALAIFCQQTSAAIGLIDERMTNEQVQRPPNKALDVHMPSRIHIIPSEDQRLLRRFGRSTTFARKVGNEADMAALISASNQLKQQQQQPQGSSYPFLATNQQQSMEDDQAIRRQLPELIAQARNDKTVERALLKMLINASLGTSVDNVAIPQFNPGFSSSQSSVNNEAWLEGGLDDSNPSSRLEQAMNEYSNIQRLPNYLGQLQDQLATMEKREYIKPCSFNAVSCTKNPFRKFYHDQKLS